MPTPKPAAPCPCHSKRAYRECCRPFHLGAERPPTAEILMRSRYAAFGAGLVDYLIDTLHPEHEDAKIERAVIAASFRSTVEGFKFTGLRIVETDDTFADGPTVTFVARLFTRGVDHSFAERSLFGVHEGRILYKKGLWTRDAKSGVYEGAPVTP